MTLLRNGLIGGILFIVFLLFIRWNDFQERALAERMPTQPEAPVISADIPTEVPTSESTSVDDLPDLPSSSGDQTIAPADIVDTPSLQPISIVTDTLQLQIDPKGGDIIQLSLPQHRARLDEEDSQLTLLTKSSKHTYIAKSDLLAPRAGDDGTQYRGPSGNLERVVFTSDANTYTMNENDDHLVVDLRYVKASGTEIIKRFSFEKGSYLVDVSYIVNNQSDHSWQASFFGQIERDGTKPTKGGMFQISPFLGAATTKDDDNYVKYSFDDIEDGIDSFSKEGGWVAVLQHYFVTAWVPDQETQNNYSFKRSRQTGLYLMQFVTPTLKLAPGQSGTLSARFYAGPKTIEVLEGIAPGLDLTVDFGILWFIGKPLFFTMDFIHDFVLNWGLAVILLTFLVKLVFFYPSAISYRSMAKMRKLMPLIQELKERYGDDRQRMGMETMKLYKKEGVNPLGGCLPMLLQMPVFMGLYWMIMEAVELRHSGFLWIDDLSNKDPFFILPITMGAIMFIQQKLNPPPQDPMQAKIFQLMPIGFTFILLFFPAALTLYMAVNTALSFLQQYVITKQIERGTS